MLASNIPAVFNIPWANSATAPYVHAVPEASQVSITPGAASLTTGFPPLNFQSYTAGGIPPFGNDLNGILNQITAWQRWTQAGGFPRYNAAFQTAIGGYPSGAILCDATSNWLWVSTVDSNVTNPDTGGAGWQQMTAKLAGSATHVFDVAPATTATQAVQASQVSADHVNFPIYTAPTVWTPTVSGITFVGANASVYTYTKVGKLMFVNIMLAAATSVTIANSASISLPVAQTTSAVTRCVSPNTGNACDVAVYGGNATFINGAAASAAFIISFVVNI